MQTNWVLKSTEKKQKKINQSFYHQEFTKKLRSKSLSMDDGHFQRSAIYGKGRGEHLLSSPASLRPATDVPGRAPAPSRCRHSQWPEAAARYFAIVVPVPAWPHPAGTPARNPAPGDCAHAQSSAAGRPAAYTR